MVLGGVISCLLFSQQNIVYLGGVGGGNDDFDKNYRNGVGEIKLRSRIPGDETM